MMVKLLTHLYCIHIIARRSASGNIVASDDNESGCLTISFSSGNNQSEGWFAEIDCQYPCQDFTVQIESVIGLMR